MRRFAGRARQVLTERPGWVTLACALLVGAHAVAANTALPDIRPARSLARASAAGDASVLFLGAATVAAMVAGFAGVVVIFVLQNPSSRFRRLRVQGGERLRANWLSIVGLSFCAAALSLAASFARLTDGPGWIWLFELAAIYLAHASMRLIWALRWIGVVVQRQDEADQEEEDRAPIETVILSSRRRPA